MIVVVVVLEVVLDVVVDVVVDGIIIVGVIEAALDGNFEDDSGLSRVSTVTEITVGLLTLISV